MTERKKALKVLGRAYGRNLGAPLVGLVGGLERGLPYWAWGVTPDSDGGFLFRVAVEDKYGEEKKENAPWTRSMWPSSLSFW